MLSIGEDPCVVILPLDINLSFIDMDEGTAQEVLPTQLVSLRIISRKIAHKIDEGPFADPHTKLLIKHVCDCGVGQAQHQALIDDPGLEAATEVLMAKSADRRREVMTPTPAAVPFGTAILCDSLMTAVVGKGQVDDGLFSQLRRTLQRALVAAWAVLAGCDFHNFPGLRHGARIEAVSRPSSRPLVFITWLWRALSQADLGVLVPCMRRSQDSFKMVVNYLTSIRGVALGSLGKID